MITLHFVLFRNQLVNQRLSMQHPRPLGKHFCSQEDCTVICWETTCLQTTHCNHSLTDCWRFSKNCLLINKQTDNMTTCCSQCESVCTSECNFSAMCPLAIGVDSTGCQLILFWLYCYIKSRLLHLCPVLKWICHPPATTLLCVEEFLTSSF